MLINKFIFRGGRLQNARTQYSLKVIDYQIYRLCQSPRTLTKCSDAFYRRIKTLVVILPDNQVKVYKIKRIQDFIKKDTSKLINKY